MGYRKIPTIYTLDDIEGEEGLIVRMKAIKVGALRKVMKATSNKGDSSDESMEEVIALMAKSLVSWNLEDEKGKPVPANAKGIDDQELELLMAIMEAWMDAMIGVDEDLGKGSTSGASSPAPPLTMEAL